MGFFEKLLGVSDFLTKSTLTLGYDDELKKRVELHDGLIDSPAYFQINKRARIIKMAVGNQAKNLIQARASGSFKRFKKAQDSFSSNPSLMYKILEIGKFEGNDLLFTNNIDGTDTRRFLISDNSVFMYYNYDEIIDISDKFRHLKIFYK